MIFINPNWDQFLKVDFYRSALRIDLACSGNRIGFMTRIDVGHHGHSGKSWPNLGRLTFDKDFMS